MGTSLRREHEESRHCVKARDSKRKVEAEAKEEEKEGHDSQTTFPSLTPSVGL
jgi:hypothetical protein